MNSETLSSKGEENSLEIHWKENLRKVGFTVIIKDKALSKSGSTADDSKLLY